MPFGVRKNKVNLSDYPYKRDIENRLILAELSAFEVDVLREIVHNSLKISIVEMAEELEAALPDLLQALNKLNSTKLFKQDRMSLIVDKDLRKYYEIQLEKFEDDFQPDMEFLQSLLNKVPMHALPAWYAVPRTSDHIFSSLIEKYLLSPQIYRQYLSELQFDDPVIHSIIQDLYETPDFKVKAADLIEKYQLTREKFEEYILLLEYHFVCCIKYEQIDQKWHEFVSPFQEWLDYLLFEKNTKLTPLSQPLEDIDYFASTDRPFAFIVDLESILDSAKKNLSKIKNNFNFTETHFEHLLYKLRQLEFVKGNDIELTEKGADWLKKTPIEKSAAIAADPLNLLRSLPEIDQISLYTARNMRLIEQTLLEKIPHKAWVYLDDFINGFIAPMGDREGIILKNKGKKWKYSFPSYSKEELTFIKSIITERFFELGITAVGHHQGKICFTLTSFGRVVLS